MVPIWCGRCCLRGVAPSKKLLLHRVICDDNLANNGELFINFVSVDNHNFHRSENYGTIYLRTIIHKDNTVGSRSKIDLAYIAGFLDGDGSLMLQIKKRKEGRKWRFMSTICFYQDKRHEEPLFWFKEKLGIGYISRRKDNITELRINGFKQVRKILENLLPFIRFKKKQATAFLKAVTLLDENSQLSRLDLDNLINLIIVIQRENYATKSKKTKEELMKILGLTP